MTGSRDKILENIIVNGALLGSKTQNAAGKKYGCNVPWTILMDPTSTCNLHCTAAGRRSTRINNLMTEMNSIVKQGKGARRLRLSFLRRRANRSRKNDLIRLCDEHRTVIPAILPMEPLLTRSSLIGFSVSKNFFFPISIEGDEAATDSIPR